MKENVVQVEKGVNVRDKDVNEQDCLGGVWKKIVSSWSVYDEKALFGLYLTKLTKK